MLESDGRTIRFRFQAAVEPEFVCRGNRTQGWLCMAMKNDTAKILTVDGRGDCPAEICRSKPSALVRGNRCIRNLVKPHELGVERCPGIVDDIWGTRGEAVVIVGVNRIDEIKFSAPEAENLDIAVRLNVEADGIQ